MIDKITEQKIKDAANIVDVMQDFLVLKRIGVRYTCLCPFHDDHNLGSFSIYPHGNLYKCFSCDAGGDSIKFLMDYKGLTYKEALVWLAHKYGIYVDEVFDREKFKAIKPAKPRENFVNPNDLPKRTWPADYIGYYTNLENDNFVKWLRAHNWDGCQRARLEQALKDYHIGHTFIHYKDKTGEEVHREMTIFWMLDEKNVLHNGHYMEYLPDGHRNKEKERKLTNTWLHARMKFSRVDKFDEDKEQPSYCLFGQHLLNAWPNATVNIVESEKTAIIMATAYGNHAADIWMACAGLERLKVETLAPLMQQGRHIQLYPDRDAIEKWMNKAAELNYFDTSINTQAVKDWWLPQDGPKADIGDVVLRMINEHN